MRQSLKQAGQTVYAYSCRTKALRGHRYSEVVPEARRLFRELRRRTKRHPYVRSIYFEGDKIFFDYFWNHVANKRAGDQVRRLKLLPCAIELLRKTTNSPITVVDTTNPRMLLHRFVGITPDKTLFYVQIREDRRKNIKQCLSIFPTK